MRFISLLLGKPLSNEEEDSHKIGVWEGVPMLGLAALGSSAYGPEAALTLLLPLGALGLAYVGPIILVILVLLAILYFSYRQTISAYPNGGGSYTVAKENLGDRAGILAAAALSLDYLLNVAVGISAGIGALVSAIPALHSYTLALCLATLVLVTVVNLRGVRASGTAWAFPTYLFVVSLIGVLGIGVIKSFFGYGRPTPIVAPPALPAMTGSVSLWLLLRAFASGCTAMTGVEAVSNGTTAFGEPRVVRAKQTLTAIVAILGILLAGIAYLARVYHVGAMDQEHKGYQSVISQLVGAIVGRGFLYYVTIGSVLAVLCLSANTSFADFPRLCRLLAEDEFLPTSFANRGRRLVFSTGIIILTVLSGIILIVFGGITDRLIPLFAVGAFLAFTLSQAGMVMHWKRQLQSNAGDAGSGDSKAKEAQASGGQREPINARQASASLAVNAVGCAVTSGTLAVILVAKFVEGAWVTVILIPSLMGLYTLVKRHYGHIASETQCERAIRTDPLSIPILIVPIRGWNTITEKAIRFALSISTEITAVHIVLNDEEEGEVRAKWAKFVEEPLQKADRAVPKLVVLQSPYRRLFTPIVSYILRREKEEATRHIAVVIPELVEPHWWNYLLHNQRATALKAALLFGKHERVAVINVPWRLNE